MNFEIGCFIGFSLGVISIFVSAFRWTDGNCRKWIGGQVHPNNFPKMLKDIEEVFNLRGRTIALLEENAELSKETEELLRERIEVLKDNTRSLENIVDIQTRAMKNAGLPVGPPIKKIDEMTKGTS